MKEGTVKFFNESKGFGFIVEEGSQNECFVHVTGLIDEIEKVTVLSMKKKKEKKE
ncbi:cold shock protein CspG [Nonlabens ulvanivorans]|nr:cold shock protein CspG [Nonlabens ulvanivorans]